MLPFTLQDVREAIPDFCFEPSAFRSLAYFALDVGIVAGLYAIAATVNQWWLFPLFWFAQGTMFWALFVVGHDCGHGSFSKHSWLNNLIGHISHSFILVPFHGWRISHRTHHANTGNIDTDESWYPLTQSMYESMNWPEKLVRFKLPLVLLAYPIYLFMRSPGRQGSHFLPSSDVFRPSERKLVITSTIWWSAMVTLLVGLALQHGLLFVANYYIMPYLVFVVWLDLVTFLHHTEDDIPWYRGKDWYFLKGAISTIDRDYGWFNAIHHDIGTHVAHHVFLSIPHYHLQTATEAIKPVLGDYYRKSDQPIIKGFLRSYLRCHFVADQGSKLYYQRANDL
ncbi:MAG: fatty acid desaturase [Synechococcales cyanobacterium RM1_1_8]|nr:fatty acid desaturase [Synechococcales cyanobacterium RM1_1_8]